MFRRKHEVGDNPLSQPVSIEIVSEPAPLTESDMLEFLGQMISEREKYISEQQEQIYSDQKDGEEAPEAKDENEPEVMSTANARISQIDPLRAFHQVFWTTTRPKRKQTSKRKKQLSMKTGILL